MNNPNARPEPVVIWDDEDIPDSHQFRAHVAWLESQGIRPAIVHKAVPVAAALDRFGKVGGTPYGPSEDELT